jgi:large subunit ribosomal protein L21
MSYAIIRSGGKQFRVAEGQTVRLPSIDTEAGETVELEALVIGGGEGGETRVGTPAVEGARVTGTVVEHGRGDKIIVFKKKRRKQYKRTRGHRQGFTAVKIDSIG